MHSKMLFLLIAALSSPITSSSLKAGKKDEGARREIQVGCVLPLSHSSTSPVVLPDHLKDLIESDPLGKLYQKVESTNASAQMRDVEAKLETYTDVGSALGTLDSLEGLDFKTSAGLEVWAARLGISKERLAEYGRLSRASGEIVTEAVGGKGLLAAGYRELERASIRKIGDLKEFPAATDHITAVYYSSVVCFPCMLLKPTLARMIGRDRFGAEWFYTEEGKVHTEKGVFLVPSIVFYMSNIAEVHILLAWPNTLELWGMLRKVSELIRDFEGLGVLIWRNEQYEIVSILERSQLHNILLEGRK